MSADKGHLDVMEILLKNKAKVNALDSLGQTALHHVAQQGNMQACRILLQYGIDRSIVSLQGLSAAQLAPSNLQKMLRGKLKLLCVRISNRGPKSHEILSPK